MSGRQNIFQNAMNQGHSAAWDQMWEQAAGFYRQALQEFPDNLSALTSLGLALFELGDYEQSLKYYMAATRVAPEDPLPVEKMGRILERLGKLTEAVQAATKAAELYFKNKDVEKTIECWTRVISLQPESIMARTRLAMIFERMGRKARAVEEYLATAALMQHSGEINRAIQIAEYCMQLDPGNSDAEKTLGKLRSNQLIPKPRRPRGGTGPVRMAEVKKIQSPQDVKEQSQDPVEEALQKALVRLASLLFDQADHVAPAEKSSRRGLTALTRGTGSLSMKVGDDPRILLHLSQAIESITHDEKEQASRELENAIEIGFDHPAAHYIVGMIMAEKDQQKALRFLRKAMKHSDFSLGSLLLMGKILLEIGEYHDAIVSLLQALAQADAAVVPPDKAEEIMQLYEPILEMQSNRSDKTEIKNICENIISQIYRNDWREYLKTARQQIPPQPEGSLEIPLAEILLETGSSKVVEVLAHIRLLSTQNKIYSAMEEAFFVLESAPTYLPLHIQIGELLLKQGFVQESVAKFLLVAQLYAVRGEVSQAVRLLRRVSQMIPMDISVHNRLVDLLASNGQVGEALEEYMNLADLHYKLAELDKARETYSSALRLAQQSSVERSWSIRILGQLADIDMQRLDLRQAVRIYEQMRTLEPEDSRVRMSIVDLNFRLGQDTAAFSEIEGYLTVLENAGKRSYGIDFMKEIIISHPDKLEARKRLADMLVREGRSQEAVVQLDSIADALLNPGNHRGAMMMIKAIISLNPPNIDEYKEALAQIQGN